MAFDSVANLLFNIGANTDDAEGNIARFRQLLSTDLDSLGDQFTDWAEGVFGALNTVKGALLGVTGALAAGAVAAAGFAIEAGHKFEEYALSVADAAAKTGASAEQMSILKFSADELGIPFDRLVQGITRFESSIYKANEGAAQQSTVFQRLGISTKDLAAGEHDMMPLLEKVADRFHALKDGTEKAAVARELFSRGGAELIRFLNLGSAGMKEMAEHAAQLGLILTDKDVVAAREYQLAVNGMKAAHEALDKEIGEHALPLLIRWNAIEIAFMDTISRRGVTDEGFLNNLMANYGLAMDRIAKTTELATKAANQGPLSGLLPPPGKAKEAAQDFEQITAALDGLHEKLAALGSPEDKLAAELVQMSDRAKKAAAELLKLHEAGKLTEEAWERESQALLLLRKAIGEYGDAMAKQLGDKELQAMYDHADAIVAAGKSLQGKLDEQSDETYERRQQKWNEEFEALKAKLEKEDTLTEANQAKLYQVWVAGMLRIANAREADYQKELAETDEHLARMLEKNMTAEQKIAAQYQVDVSRFSAAEEAKALKLAGSEAEQAETHTRYAAVRRALYADEQNRLQELQNSQGWQGVFGSHFGELLKDNEDLAKQWAESTNQSLMLVSVAVEDLGKQGEDAFGKMAQGMGAGIANAIVYDKSIGQAMRSATAATLESLAAQAMTEAIFSLAWGFMDLAQGNIPAADAAFEAAALFGAVGFASAVAGRAIAPRSASAGAGSGGGAQTASGSPAYGGGGGGYGGGGGGGLGGPGGQGLVTMNVYGHVIGQSGIEELTGMINDAVQNRDVRLVASQTRQSTLATF